MIDARVPVLRKRLAELGLDRARRPAPSAELYDEPLAAVVKTYQETKGLTVDGVIGANTTRSLNTSIDDRIEQVIANLERRRWLPEDLGSRYVLVNAGDYSMVFVDGGKKVFESLVIVGTPKDPTPEIQSVMRGFQTNPYWTVPQSISGEEYLPMLRRDPNALAAGGFKIFSSWSDDDSEIDPGDGRLEQHQPQGVPLPHPPGAGRRAMRWATSSSASRTSTASTCTTRRAAGCSPRAAATSATAASACRTRSTSPRRCSSGRPGFDKARVQQVIDAGPAGALQLPRAGDPVRDLPHGRASASDGTAGVPRRRLRPRQAGRRGDGQAAQLG